MRTNFKGDNDDDNIEEKPMVERRAGAGAKMGTLVGRKQSSMTMRNKEQGQQARWVLGRSRGYTTAYPLTNNRRIRSAKRTMKPDPSIPDPSKPSPLTSLPPELRNYIYKLVFPSDQILGVRRFSNVRHAKKKPKFSEPALLRTCKFIRKEASGLLFHMNSFDIGIKLQFDGFSATIAWLKFVLGYTKSSSGAQKTFSDLRFHVMGALWGHLESFVPLAEFLRTTGLEPGIITTTDERAPYGKAKIDDMKRQDDISVFVVVNDRPKAFQAVKSMLALGVRAHVEGWTKQELEDESGVEIGRLRGPGAKSGGHAFRQWRRQNKLDVVENGEVDDVEGGEVAEEGFFGGDLGRSGSHFDTIGPAHRRSIREHQSFGAFGGMLGSGAFNMTPGLGDTEVGREVYRYSPPTQTQMQAACPPPGYFDGDGFRGGVSSAAPYPPQYFNGSGFQAGTDSTAQYQSQYFEGNGFQAGTGGAASDLVRDYFSHFDYFK